MLQPAALASLLLATQIPAAAMPIRESDGLAVDCRVEGLPKAETAAAEASLCARVVESARRGAPFPVTVDRSASEAAARLSVKALINRSGRVAITALLARPGQSATAARLSATPPAVAYNDAAAVDAAIDTALAAVLPWRKTRPARLPSPPRAY